MKLRLLLVSLLVSNLSPLGDGDCVIGYYSWRFCRKLLLNKQMVPKGLETLLTQTVQYCMRIQRNCVHVTVLHEKGNVPSHQGNKVHRDHGCLLPHQALMGIIHSSYFPIMIVFLLHKDGERFPDFLSQNTLPGICLRSEDTTADSRISSIATDKAKDGADSQSVRLVHRASRSVAFGFRDQTFLMERSKSWATATIAQWQKMLTTRYYAAAIVIISCCLKEAEIGSAWDIEKIPRQHIAEPQMRQEEDTQQVRDSKYLKQDDRQYSSKALVSQHDISQAAALHSGSSSIKPSDLSQSEIHRNAAGVRRKVEHSNLDEEPSLRRDPQKQLSLKAATGADANGFYVNRLLTLVSREKIGSMKRLRHNLRTAHFSVIIIRGQAEPRPPERERETEGAREHGKQKKSANVVQSDFAEEGEEGLIELFLPDTQMETQTEPASARPLILNTDTGWKTVHMELGEPPPMKQNSDSICKCLKESKLVPLEMDAVVKEVGRHVKPASVYMEGQVQQATGKTGENMSTNHTEQEGNMPSQESVIPNERMETQTMKTYTTGAETKDTTSSMSDVLHQSSTRTSTEETSTSTVSPEPGMDSVPERGTGKFFTGLRMREDVLAHMKTPHKGEVKNEAIAATNRRNEDQHDRGGNSFTSAKLLEMIQKQAADNLQKTTDVPICRGLIHRTDAGRKHCMERFAGSRMFSSGEPTQSAFGDKQRTSIRDPKDNSRNHDEYDHFYYFDGALKRVPSNFYPRYRRQMSQTNAENSFTTVRTKEGTQGNLLHYINRLALRNKVTSDDQEDDVQSN